MHRKMIQKYILLSPLLILIIMSLGCTASLTQLYPDTYFPEDHIYRNKTIGFLLNFRGNWDLVTDPAHMSGASREFAGELHRQGGELLFVGTTIEQHQGVRAIAFNLNVSSQIYAEKIRKLNQDAISQDLGLTDLFASGKHMVRWDYTIAGFRFVEFFFTVDTYNIRVAFWSQPPVFDRFESVYLDIISSLSVVDRY